ncbi:hypothetical protein [Variovorax sp. RA8]|uniref:hypothetical protein n=1 Tax=Variovorax sp. (strain JCM 16519 / RA8) TaxID=662548 RepID=UPI000A90B43E|nr:hypothetical protein [Variovorax sp. RA8]VTU34100.1 hypothetical protein RA8CHR_04904 [Variovorax sp. RA8]
MDYEHEIKELHGVIDTLVGMNTALMSAVTLMLRLHPKRNVLIDAYPQVREFISNQSLFLPLTDESMAFAQKLLDELFQRAKDDD